MCIIRISILRNHQLSCKTSIDTEINLLGQAVNATCKVLGHSTALNSLDTHPLQNLGESTDKQRHLEKVCFISGS